jgi:hypothetical protein
MKANHRLFTRPAVATAALILASGILALPTAAVAAPDDLAPLAGPPALSGPSDLRAYADSLISGLDPATHAGVHVDPATRALTVLTVTADADRAVTGRLTAQRDAGVKVATVRATRSLATLEALREGLWKQIPADLAPRVFAAQVDTLTNRVVVEVDEPTDDVRRQLKALFGDAVAVRGGERAVMLNRYMDSSPWWSGDRIMMRHANGAYAGACTSGFGATYLGTEVMVTAGHCAPYGSLATPTVITNGRMPGENGCTTATGCNWGTVGSFGTVWQTRFRTYTTQAGAEGGPLSTDLALIRSDTAQRTHVVGSETATSPLNSFPGAGHTPAGQVCHSGATSLGSCQFTIQANLTTVIAEAGGHFARIQIWRANGTTSTSRACQGDSGGLVYQHFTSGVGETVLGVLSTGNGGSRPGLKGVACTSGFGFTYWGQGRTPFAGYTPLIN